MKNTTDKTTKLLGTLFAALCACALAACGDGGATGTDAGSEEANLSSEGGSSDSGSSSEGTSAGGSSETSSSSSSSSSSFYYSYSGPYMQCGGTGQTLFDYSAGNYGTGTMVLDDSHYSDPASAQTVLLHADGNYYPAAQGWTEGCGWECPFGDPVEENGQMVSPCYWGWNDGDMLTDSSVRVGVKLMAFVDSAGWGHANGGFLYINGANFRTAQEWNVYAGSITVVFKGVAGMPVKIYLKDKVEYGSTEGVPKAGVTANGQWQTFTAPVSDFQPYSGATNTLNPYGVIGIGLQYELGAATEGEPCAQCSDEVMNLEWQSLRLGF